MTTRTEAHQILGLAPGEIYHGLVLADDGETFEHLVEGPEIAGSFTHDEAIAAAKKSGYQVPTRCEGLILEGNEPLLAGARLGRFWLLERHAENGEYALAQSFLGGNHFTRHKDDYCSVRAVRRIPVGRLA